MSIGDNGALDDAGILARNDRGNAAINVCTRLVALASARNR